MGININVYSNANASSKAVAFEFYGDVFAGSKETLGSNTAAVEYYIKVTTGARQTDNSAIPIKIIKSFDDLALGTKQSASNTANAYGDIRSMVIDYVYDAVNGHEANQFESGCTSQLPMKF